MATVANGSGGVYPYSDKTAGISLAIVADTVAVGETYVVCIACDNTATGGASPITSVGDQQGNTWSKAGGTTDGNGAANDGVTVEVWYSRVTTVPQFLEFNFSVNVTAKAMATFVISGNATFDDVATTVNGTAASLTTWLSGDGAIAVTGFEGTTTPTADSDTTNGSWSTQVTAGTSGGNAATNIRIGAQYKNVTGTGTQTYSTTGLSGDQAFVLVRFLGGLRRTASSTGLGSSSATGSSGPRTISRTATSSGTGSSSAARLVTDLRTASGSGSGASTATHVVTRQRTGSAAGTGSSSAARQRVVLRTATASGAGSSAADRTAVRVRTATSAGIGSSSAARTVTPARTATGSGAGSSSATGSRLSVTTSRTASGAGTGTGAADATSARARSASGTGVGGGTAEWTDLFVVVQTDSGTAAETETLAAALAAIESALGSDDLGSRAFDDADAGRWFDLHSVRYTKGKTMLGAALSGIPDRSERPIR